MLGRPAILIPLPTAADDHQTRNAAEFARAGAAVIADQQRTTPEALARLIVDLAANSERRARMSRAMTGLGRPGAAREIVDELERVVGLRGETGSHSGTKAGVQVGVEPGAKVGAKTGAKTGVKTGAMD